MQAPSSSPPSEKVFVLVLGYYGNHADMTWNTMEKAMERTIAAVENDLKLDWSNVVWLCSGSTWMSLIPVFLYLRGLGSGIEIYTPCELKLTGNQPRFVGDVARALNTSHDHMENRIREGMRHQQASAMADGRLLMRACVQQGGSIQTCDGWKAQGARLTRRATHFIHLPHIDPDHNYTDRDKKTRYWSHGGHVYDKFAGPKVQDNVYEVVRRNKFQLPNTTRNNK